jgi:hypothetical protein
VIEPPAAGPGSSFSIGQVRLRDTLVSLLNLAVIFAAVTGD